MDIYDSVDWTEMPAVKHQPNVSSGGQISYTDIGKFLRNRVSAAEAIGALLDDG